MPYSDIEKRRAYARKYHAENPKPQRSRVRERNLHNRSLTKEFLLKYLEAHPCVDCGEPDPIVLEFDHRDPNEKLFNIGNFRNKGKSLRNVKEEVDKCDVRCANCHRRKTHRDRLLGLYTRS